MLVIGNNCISARLYEQLKLEFNNPFIWMVLPYDSVCYLMSNWDSINFNKFEIKASKFKNNTFVLIIDGKIELHFVHYVLDKNANMPLKEQKYTKDGAWWGNVRFKDIESYIKEKYITRLNRMKQCNEEPVFLLRDEVYAANNNSSKTMKDVANNTSKYKRIIITRDKSITRNDSVCKTIHIDKLDTLEHTVQTYITEITGFLN